jgi:hypothetical protein
VFFGESGMVMLRCMAREGYVGRGQATCARYEFEYYDIRYVDKRDLPGLPRDEFEKVILE